MTQLFSFAQSRSITIAEHTFVITERSYAYAADKGVTMTLYKESGETKQKIFSFVLENELGNCSDKGIQEGAYEIKGNKITFYSHWRREGKAYRSPVGDRIMVYEVTPEGLFQKVSSKLYIEREHSSDENETAYVLQTEQLFRGIFVYGDEVKELKADVHDAIERKHKDRWK